MQYLSFEKLFPTTNPDTIAAFKALLGDEFTEIDKFEWDTRVRPSSFHEEYVRSFETAVSRPLSESEKAIARIAADMECKDVDLERKDLEIRRLTDAVIAFFDRFGDQMEGDGEYFSPRWELADAFEWSQCLRANTDIARYLEAPQEE